jgi:hypothetical protein
MCDHRVCFHRCVVRQWYNPSGSAVVTCLNATARTRRAERVVQSDVLSVWQVLHGTPSAPLISAQRVARFDDHCTSNLFINNKLRQRYSRFIRSGDIHDPLRDFTPIIAATACHQRNYFETYSRSKPYTMKVVRMVFNGGDEETSLYRPRLVATNWKQLLGNLRRKGFVPIRG